MLRNYNFVTLHKWSNILWWWWCKGGTWLYSGHIQISLLCQQIAFTRNWFWFSFQELSSKKSLDKSSLFDGSQAGGILLGAEQEAMSSSELLTCMHKRKQFGAQPDASMDNMPSSSISRDDQELLEDLRNFIAFMSDINGQATTHELLTNFGPRLPPSDSAKFKAMLVQICNFNKVDGLGIWRLKQEFR